MANFDTNGAPYVTIYRIARNFRGLKFSRIGLPENFRDFIFAASYTPRNDVMTYGRHDAIDKNFSPRKFLAVRYYLWLHTPISPIPRSQDWACGPSPFPICFSYFYEFFMLINKLYFYKIIKYFFLSQ